MAAKRGGRTVPNKPASYSGVGKQSRRTDGQPVRSPNVQEGTDLTIGDRATIEAGQRSQPLSRTPTPRVAPPRPQASPALGPSGMEEMPQFLASMPSTRPMEDPATPAVAPPDADDDREFVLQVLSSAPWGNNKVREMLNDLHAERTQTMAPPTLGPVASPGLGASDEDAALADEEPPAQELGADTSEPLPEEDMEEDFI